MKPRIMLIVCAVLAAGAARGQTLEQRMLDSSVSIYASSSGSPGARDAAGLLLDERHVATNLTACCSRTAAPEVVLGKTVANSKLVWSSKDSDLAILELDRPLNTPGATLAAAKLWRQGQGVYTVQFNPSGSASVISGRIQELSATPPGAPKMFQITAPILEGNAGGALFDACGDVAGINLMPKGGKPYAYAVDPLVAGMVSAGVPAHLAMRACPVLDAGLGSDWFPNAVWVSGILIATVLGWAGTRAALNKRALLPAGLHAPGPGAPAYIPPKPFLRAIAGQYMGGSFPLDSGPSTLGRDPLTANLVFGAESDSISKRHCTVSWDATRQVFVIEDHGSTNGTYLGTGERLRPHVRRDLRPGDRFYIGDLRNRFEVILDI